MSDKTQSERVHLAASASEVLAHGAFVKLRQHLMEAIASTSFEQADAREKLYLSIQLLTPVEAMLMEIVNDGAVARDEIETAKILDAATEGRRLQ